MIAVSSIAVTLWLGGWMRPFPNALSGDNLGPGVLADSRPSRSSCLAAMTFYSTVRMPKHPFFRVQTIGLGGFGAVLALIGLILLVPAGARSRAGHLSGSAPRSPSSMYMYIWYRGTFPRYRFDQLMKVGWKVLLPMGIGVLVLTGIVGLRAEIWDFLQRPGARLICSKPPTRSHNILLLFAVGIDRPERRAGHHPQECGALRAGPDRVVARAWPACT